MLLEGPVHCTWQGPLPQVTTPLWHDDWPLHSTVHPPAPQAISSPWHDEVSVQ